MKHLKVLVVTDKEIAIKILNWNIEVVQDTEDALALLQKQDYRVIAIENSLAEADRRKLESLAKLFNSGIPVVGFSSEQELDHNVRQAFREQRMALLGHNYLDNAFEIELAGKIQMN